MKQRRRSILQALQAAQLPIEHSDRPRALSLSSGTSIFSSWAASPQLAQGPGLDLPDPLLGHAHFGPDLFERQRFVAA